MNEQSPRRWLTNPADLPRSLLTCVTIAFSSPRQPRWFVRGNACDQPSPTLIVILIVGAPPGTEITEAGADAVESCAFACQSALEWDPLSASKRDPFDRRVFAGSARGVGAGWGCGDGASAGCLIVVAAFKTPAVVTSLDDVTVMSKAVEQRSGHLGVAEHAGPFAEGQIGGEDDGGALVEPADEVEQELTA